MEVRTSNSTLTSTKTDLSIKEAILGKLVKKKQELGILRMKDFDETINDLGYSKDSNTVKSILKNCKVVDNDMNIDINHVKDSINIERGVYNAKVMKKTIQNKIIPQEFDSSKQIKTVEENKKQVQTIYKMLSKHEIDTETASYLLSLHNIHPTKQFMKVADTMNLAQEVKLVDFTRSLTTGEPVFEQGIDQITISTPIAAGSKTRTKVDKFEEPLNSVNILNSSVFKPSTVFTIGNETVLYRTTRKMSDERHLNANEIKNTLQHQPVVKRGKQYSEKGKQGSQLDEYTKTRRILGEARSYKDHGDCVTWNQAPKETELKDDSYVKARKGTMKLSDIATDVITWDRHHDRGAKAPETAYWDEFKKDGGFQISKGIKNIPSLKDILSFNPKGSADIPTPIRSKSAFTYRSNQKSLFNQEEKALAGSPSKTESNVPFYTDFKSRKILTQTIHHATEKPYDIESSKDGSNSARIHLVFNKEANSLVHGDPNLGRTFRKQGFNNQATIQRNPIIG